MTLVCILEYQVVKYATVPYNIGEGFDPTTSVFKAPKEGLYKFTVRSYAFTERTFLGVALHSPSSLLVKTGLWVRARSPGVASALLPLKIGEGVVPVFYAEEEPVASADLEVDRGPLFNEFSGELVAEMCGGKPCT
jgi:hypothetical protein